MVPDRPPPAAGPALRRGVTTGSCAAMAAGAAARLLLTGRAPARAVLATPAGTDVAAAVEAAERRADSAVCAVRKDAGDDPDATDGVLVRAEVRLTDAPGVAIDGGEGVGRVTRPGLDQPVGAAAINSGPRAMIARELERVAAEHGYRGGWRVVVSIPGGEEVARRTFNAGLGIVGGLSVLGTSGIVEPMSTRALVDTMRAAMRVARAEGTERLAVTPGNYGQTFARAHPALSRHEPVKCANFVGEAVDAAAELRFAGLLVVGHIGKMVKVAGGVMDTHSRVADCRLDVLALHAALAGVDPATLRRLLDSATVEAALEQLAPAARAALPPSLAERAEWYLARRAAGALPVGALIFTHAGAPPATGPTGRALLAAMEKRD